MPKPDPRPSGAEASVVTEAVAPTPAVASPPASEAKHASTLEHYLVLQDLPDVADAGRVLKARPARVRAWLDASAVRMATAREVEIAAPRFVVLED